MNARPSPTIYQLKILAFDGGDLESFNFANVCITVNDQIAYSYFNSSFYDISIREDTLPGITVAKMRANALRRPLNHFIMDGNRDEFFQIDSSTGQIHLVKYLDVVRNSDFLLNIGVSAM